MGPVSSEACTQPLPVNGHSFRYTYRVHQKEKKSSLVFTEKMRNKREPGRAQYNSKKYKLRHSCSMTTSQHCTYNRS